MAQFKGLQVCTDDGSDGERPAHKALRAAAGKGKREHRSEYRAAERFPGGHQVAAQQRDDLVEAGSAEQAAGQTADRAGVFKTTDANPPGEARR